MRDGGVCLLLWFVFAGVVVIKISLSRVAFYNNTIIGINSSYYKTKTITPIYIYIRGGGRNDN